MKTEVLKANKSSVVKAAGIIRAGGIVAFPTETVYGLGADATNAAAVAKIFDAKGRPSDNPLIVHISCFGDLKSIALEIPAAVEKLMKELGPAPLTYVVKKNGRIPDIVTAGLDTVAVRIPAHPSALALIKECGAPIAAPSANVSGRPSPTEAAHVLADLDGKIPLILDGGQSGFGVESTVADFTAETPLILRPGGFSKEKLEAALGREVRVYKKPETGTARSPGLKYAHYAPRCKTEVIPYGADVIKMLKKVYDNNVQKGKKPVILCSNTYSRDLGGRTFVSIGSTDKDAANSLFRLLRENEDKFDVIICHLLPDEGLGRAFNDRLRRAAGGLVKNEK